MKVLTTNIPDVRILEPSVFEDERGKFLETYNERQMIDLSLPARWVQDNYSVSKRNVVRGIHYQVVRPQAKLVRVTFGRVLDVAVDLRRKSATFGKHVVIELSAENNRIVFIPEGFGHAFLVLSDRAGFAYKTSDFYEPSGERTILWNDPQVAIEWPIVESEAIVSAKDRKGLLLQDAQVFL